MKLRVLITLAFVAGCSHGGPTAPLDRAFKVAVGETTAIQGTPLTLTFKRVSADSRCPSTAICVHAGSATIELEAKVNGVPTMMTLNTPNDPTEATVDQFRIRFAALEPYPTGTPIEEKQYRATLLIQDMGCPITMLCTQ